MACANQLHWKICIWTQLFGCCDYYLIGTATIYMVIQFTPKTGAGTIDKIRRGLTQH